MYANLVVTVGKRLGQKKAASASASAQTVWPTPEVAGKLFPITIACHVHGSLFSRLHHFLLSFALLSSSLSSSFLYLYPLFFIPSFILFITIPETESVLNK